MNSIFSVLLTLLILYVSLRLGSILIYLILNLLYIPGYSLFHLDRNRHGGGVAMFIKFSLSPSLTSLPSNSSEFLLCSIIIFQKRSLHVSTFYRPPSTPGISALKFVLSQLRFSTLSNLIIVGDFNVNFSTSSSISPLLYELKSLANLYSFR